LISAVSEDWETGNQSGGSGWSEGSWQSWDAPCLVESADSPHGGTYHMEADADAFNVSDVCDVYRTFDTTGCFQGNISFWAKANSLEAGDDCRYYYYNGSSYTEILTLSNGDDDNTYRFYSFEVCDTYGTSTNSRFRINADVSRYTDDCWTDDIIFNSFNSTGNAISGKFNQTYDASYDWFLEVYKVTSGTSTIHIQAYNNSDDVSSQEVTHTLAGTGFFDTNVSPLMDYMTNIVSMSFSQFRIWSEDSINISELILRKEANDTTAPSIVSCSINDTAISCFGGVYLDCNITDDTVVDDVFYQINGVNYTAMQDITHWEYDFAPTGESDTLYDWQQVYAIDIVSNQNQSDPSLSFIYNCSALDYINITNIQLSVSNSTANITWDTNIVSDSLVDYGVNISITLSGYDGSAVTSHFIPLTNLTPLTTYFYNVTSSVGVLTQTLGVFNFTTAVNGCTENWTAQYGSCLTNDSMLKTYYDANSCGTGSPPADNGTYVYCNYCSEDVVCTAIFGCYWNGTHGLQNFTCMDNNYFGCCILTSLFSDCSILYSPYNDTYVQSCVFVNEDFELELDLELFFGFGIGGLKSDKVDGKIFINQTNVTYYCLSYVKTSTGQVIQTNPPYTKRSLSTITLIAKEIEDREFFVTRNGLANVYWTSDDLVFDGRSYVFGVECSGGGNRLISEQVSDVYYEPVNSPITRWFWAKENIMPIVLFVLLGIIIVLAVAWVIKKVRFG